MVNVKDVPPDALIRRLAAYLKENVQQMKPAPWSLYAKSGARKDTPPQNMDWWYIRAASLLRKIYLNDPVGVESLRMAYSYRAPVGKKARAPRTRKSAGAPIRNILHQLEQAGLVTKVPGKGRTLTPQGRGLLDRMATQLAKELVKTRPELGKYITPNQTQQ
ncbi:MAG: 30S ribosomal protein S19e [Thermocladium sp.]|jgi:small subunit ribosomal protein S19e